MSWKEKLVEEEKSALEFGKPRWWEQDFKIKWQQHFQGSDIQYADKIIIDFISTEIIEKLIEEIPDRLRVEGEQYSWIKWFKQQLRDKWL